MFPLTAHDNYSQSRKITLGNLPPGICLAQVVRGLRDAGGLAKISLHDTQAIANYNQSTALLEFLTPEQVKSFIIKLRKTPLLFESRRGQKHMVDVWVVSTQSNVYTDRVHHFLSNKGLRVITLSPFPETKIWFFLNILGVQNVMDVVHDDERKTLMVEFASSFAADRAQELAVKGAFLFRDDASQSQGRNLHSYRISSGHKVPVTKYLDPDFARNTWDQSPFNSYWPTEMKPIMRATNLQPRPKPKPPTQTPEPTGKLEFVTPQKLTEPQQTPKQPELDLIDLSEEIETISISTLIPSAATSISVNSPTVIESSTASTPLSTPASESLIDGSACEVVPIESTSDLITLTANTTFERIESSPPKIQINMEGLETYGKLAQHRRKLEKEGRAPQTRALCYEDCNMCRRLFAAAEVPSVVKQYLEAAMKPKSMQAYAIGGQA